MVPGLRERAQQGITFDEARRDRRIYATDQEHGLHSGVHVLVGITEGVRGGSAAGGDYVAVPSKSEAHTDFTRDRAHGSARNAEQADLLDMPGMPEPVLFLGELLRAAARAQDYA